MIGSRHIDAVQFESEKPYDSVEFMSWEAWGRGELAVRAVTLHRHLPQACGGFRCGLDNPVLEQETAIDEELDLPWQVVVHNDPINLMSYVTMVFQKVLGFSRDKAEKHMLEVHQKGRSVVWSGVRERGELYVQQLHGYLLLATLERVQ